MRTAALVSCGSAKSDVKELSWKLYELSLFEKSWTAAMYLGDPYVMSAKHELVHGTDRLEPYDESLKEKIDEQRFHWGRGVVSDLSDGYDVVVLLGGRLYVGPVRCALEDMRPGVEVCDPYVHTTGNGQQMRVADKIVEARTQGATVEQALEYATREYRSG